MARDPLPILLRIRRVAVDQARRQLADRMREQLEAQQRATYAEGAIARETRLAHQAPPETLAIAARPTWFGHGRRHLAATRAGVGYADDRAGQAQAELADALAARQVAEELLARQRNNRDTRAARRDTATLDEIGHRRSK